MPASSGGWTFSTLFTYFDSRLKAVDRLLEERHAAAAGRFTTINTLLEQVRQTTVEHPTRNELDSIVQRLLTADQRLTDEATEYLRKDEYIAAHQRLVDQIDELKAHDDIRSGELQHQKFKQTRSEWTVQNIIVGILGIAAIVVNVIHK
jgi:hypothetical protein